MRGKQKHIASLGASVITLFVAGCATEAGAPPSAFGDSVAHNIAAQTVDPDAPRSNEPLVMDGARAAIGQGRYIADTVEAPREANTSTQGAGGGGGR